MHSSRPAAVAAILRPGRVTGTVTLQGIANQRLRVMDFEDGSGARYRSPRHGISFDSRRLSSPSPTCSQLGFAHRLCARQSTLTPSTPPQTPPGFACLSLELNEPFHVLHIGWNRHHLRVPQPHQLGVDHNARAFLLRKPHICQHPAVVVAELHIRFELGPTCLRRAGYLPQPPRARPAPPPLWDGGPRGC